MIRWSRKWQPAPVFLPGKFHEQRSLARYSPWGVPKNLTQLSREPRSFMSWRVAKINKLFKKKEKKKRKISVCRKVLKYLLKLSVMIEMV